MKSKAQLYFILTGAVGLSIILIPILAGSFLHLIWTLALGFGFGAQLLWRGGRFKIRSEMVFGPKSNFTDEEIAEFFVDRPGFRNIKFDSDYN